MVDYFENASSFRCDLFWCRCRPFSFVGFGTVSGNIVCNIVSKIHVLTEGDSQSMS